MVRPVHVCCGLVFRQPQSTVLMAYQPGASGAPAFSPTVSPGCVTEPARAGTAVQSDRTPAAANFVNLLFMLAPWFLGVACVPHPYDSQWLPIATGSGQLAGGRRIFWQLLPKCCRPSVELTAYKSYSIHAGVLGGFAVSHANVWHRGRRVTLVPAHFRAGFPTDFLVVGSHVCCGFVFLRR